MLILSRKRNEAIVINNDITVVVVDIRGDRVRLGVECAREIPVHRREVQENIERNDGKPKIVVADCGHRTTVPRKIVGKTYCPTCSGQFDAVLE